MPTYTYRFEDGTEIEESQAITDEAYTEAIHPFWCRILPVKRVYSAPSVVLKGRGFYRTGG